MINKIGEKGFVRSIPADTDTKEVSVGLELTVRGEVADMWLLERFDGSHTYFPKSHFQLHSESNIRDHIDDCMLKVDDVIQVAELQGKSKIVEFLQDIKERLNDITMDDEV